MRYIYAIKKKSDRDKVDLRYYENEIKEILTSLCVIDEKSISVKEKSFEFSYPGRMPEGYPQIMGKKLSRIFTWKYRFVRQKNTAYAFISYDGSRAEDEQIAIEFADRSTIDFNNDYKHDNMPEWVHFYSKVELSTAYISTEKAAKIFGGLYELTNKNEIVALVKINHRHIKAQKYIEFKENNTIKNPIRENTCIIEHLYSAGNYQPEYLDLADVEYIGEVKKKENDLLQSKFDTDKIKLITCGQQGIFNVPIKNKYSDYIFTVYNVGQALATSFGENNKKPFLYFDYGISCGNQKFTLPSGASDVELPLDENTTILLSHIHEDHWCGFRINPGALKCRWIIPQQKLSKALAKMLSNVKLNGGTFLGYKKEDINIFRINSTDNYILTGNKFKSKPVSKNVHMTGKALYIFAEHNGKEYKIVVSGDQYYDYQDYNYLNGIDLLVACHHGGKYSKKATTAVPLPNPKNKIVYSYGSRNTYGHPSRKSCTVYRSNKWRTEHHTPINSNFSIKLKLINNTAQITRIMKSYPTICWTVI